MDDTIDLLKIKIEKAKRDLPLEAVNAIDAVDWRAAILSLRDKSGYTFEQLGDLELETELVLCGLVNAVNYPRELETRMQISRAQANELVNEMNELVFKKIKEELIKNSERKKVFANKNVVIKKEEKIEEKIEKINEVKERLPIPEKLEIKGEVIHPMLAQKFSGSVQTPIVKTEHTLENITKTAPEIRKAPLAYPPKKDPYRLSPDE